MLQAGLTIAKIVGHGYNFVNFQYFCLKFGQCNLYVITKLFTQAFYLILKDDKFE